MKRNLKIIALLFFGVQLLSSCTREEAVGYSGNDPAVSFSASVSEPDGETRAVVEGESLTDGTYFGVYAYLGSSTTPYTDSRNGNTVSNLQIGHNGAYYNAAHKFNWPSSTETLNFHAYYPHNGSGITANFSQATKTIVFVTPTNADVDLMYATASGTRNNTDGKVGLTFSHLLAWLHVRAKVVDETNSTLEITKVSLKALPNGTYTLSSGAWASSGTRTSWSEGTISKSPGASLTAVGDFMIVPQGLKGNANNSLTIDYKLNGANETLTVENTDLPNILATSKGYKFILDVTFTLVDGTPEVSVSSSVVNWTPIDLGGISVE